MVLKGVGCVQQIQHPPVKSHLHLLNTNYINLQFELIMTQTN